MTLSPSHWHAPLASRPRRPTPGHHAPHPRHPHQHHPPIPTGEVFSSPNCKAIAGLAIQHDLFILTDEIYEYFLSRRRRARQPRDAPRHGRAHHHHLRPLQNLQHHRLARRLSNRQPPNGYHPIGYFHDLTYVCSPGPFNTEHRRILLSLRPPSTNIAGEYQQKRDQTLRRPHRRRPHPIYPRRRLLCPRRLHPHPGRDRTEESPNLLAAYRCCSLSRDLHSLPQGAAKTSSLLLRQKAPQELGPRLRRAAQALIPAAKRTPAMDTAGRDTSIRPIDRTWMTCAVALSEPSTSTAYFTRSRATVRHPCSETRCGRCLPGRGLRKDHRCRAPEHRPASARHWWCRV